MTERQTSSQRSWKRGGPPGGDRLESPEKLGGKSNKFGERGARRAPLLLCLGEFVLSCQNKFFRFLEKTRCLPLFKRLGSGFSLFAAFLGARFLINAANSLFPQKPSGKLGEKAKSAIFAFSIVSIKWKSGFACARN